MSEPEDKPGLRSGRGKVTRKKARPAAPAAWTEFRGVSRRPTGKYGAQIRESKGKVHFHRWLGTFATAEDAARAYDAAAVKLHGAMAATNFKQPAAIDDGGVSPLLAVPSGQDAGTKLRRVHRHQGVAGRCGSRGKAAVDELTPAERKKVDELLKDLNSTDDREALMEAAAILRQMSLAAKAMAGQAGATLTMIEALRQTDDDGHF